MKSSATCARALLLWACAFFLASAAQARDVVLHLPIDAALADPVRENPNQRDSERPGDESVCQAGKDRDAHFLTLPKPRAFALLEDGRWRFWADTPDAASKLFEDCARLGKRCWLYAIDDNVVRQAGERRRISSVAPLRALTEPIAPKDEHQ